MSNEMKEPSGRAGNGAQAPTEPEQLISLAQAYFAADFPNPERAGCPAPGSLSALARSGRMPDDELQAHLFGCSECFREFRAALSSARPQTAAAVSWWSRLSSVFTLRPGFALAGVFAVFIGLMIVSLVWRFASRPAEPGLIQKIPETAGTGNAPDQSSGSATLTATPNAPPQIDLQAPERQVATVMVRVDLDDYPALRDASQPDSGKPIRLPRSRIRLRLRLPERSAPGRYQIRVVDAADNSHSEGTGSSRDGTSLTVSLDLSRLAERTYRLSIAHAGEAPDYYPMVVTGARAAPKSRP